MGKIALSLCVLGVMGCSSDSGPDSTLMPDAGLGQPDSGMDNEFIPEPDDTELRSITPTACRFEVAENVLAKEHYCGDLIAPEDRDNPRSRTIQLHFLQIIGEKSEGASSATIYLDGGPGGNGEGIMRHYAANPDFLDGLLATGDVLVYGQRGTQFSVPALNCTFPGDCPAVASLEYFTTSANADDINELRRALNYDFLNLLGISYGSRLGLELMRRHEKRLRSVIIEGIVPSQTNWYANTTKVLLESIRDLERLCQNDSTCRIEAPNLLDSFVTGFQVLNDSPVIFENNRIDGESFVYVLQTLLYSYANYPVIPRIINELSNQRTATISAELTQVFDYLNRSNESLSSIATGLYYSVVCSELFNPYAPIDYEDAIESVPMTFHSRVSSKIDGIDNFCQNWPREAADENYRVGVESNARTLVISGSVDPITPPSYALIANEGLSQSTNVVIDGFGHGASIQSECGRKLILDHITNPIAELDTSCVSAYRIPFASGNTMVRSHSRLSFESVPFEILEQRRRILK